MGVNHNGKLSLAKKLIEHAKFAGADFVKFQCYSTNELVTSKAKKAKYQGPVTHSYDPKQGGGGREDMSGATGTKKGGFSNPGKGAYGPWSAEGGYMTGDTRSRYSNGGRVGILSVF